MQKSAPPVENIERGEEINSFAFSSSWEKIVTTSDSSFLCGETNAPCSIPRISATVWEKDTHTSLCELRGHTNTINSVAFSADEKKIVTASEDRTAKVWDAKSGTVLTTLVGHVRAVTARFLFDCQKIEFDFIDYYSRKQTTQIWDRRDMRLVTFEKGSSGDHKLDFDNGKALLSGGKQKDEILADTELANFSKILKVAGTVLFSKLSPNCKKVVTSDYFGDTKIWDIKSGKLLSRLKGAAGFIVGQFSPNSKLIAGCSEFGTTKVWDVQTGNLLTDLNVHLEEDIILQQFSPDSKRLIIPGKYITIWNLTDYSLSAKLTFSENESTRESYEPQFSDDGKRILTTAYGDSLINIWDSYSYKLLYSIPVSRNEILQDVSWKNGLMMTYENYQVHIYDINNKNRIFSITSIDSNDYIIQIYSGYYWCTPNATKLLHYITSSLKVIAFEQLDVKYNRPDLVVQCIGNPNPSLLSAYRKAYEKRIRRLSIDTSAFTKGFSLPEADFSNRDSIDYNQANNELKLNIKGKDSSSPLDRLNVWINEIPLFGSKGYSLKGRKIYNLDTTLTVTLSDNVNNIETSVTDVNGIESYRIPLSINYTPKNKAKEKTYFIGIGIDQFKDISHNLQWSVTDIRNLADSFKSKYKGDMLIYTLFNEDVTVEKIKALKQTLNQTAINDKVIIAYSGHGLLSDSFDYYLSTYNVNFNKPEEGGLSYDVLENLLDSIPARKKLMLLDACHSGEVDKEEMQHYKQVQARLDSNKISRGTILENKDSTRLGMTNSFELMQELFVNVGRSTGATVISAAAGTQFALEKNDLKDGVFTYSILEYMKDHSTCTVTELKKYVNERVISLTEGLQQPTARTENLNYNWSVW